jgi:hypothetical protein
LLAARLLKASCEACNNQRQVTAKSRTCHAFETPYLARRVIAYSKTEEPMQPHWREQAMPVKITVTDPHPGETVFGGRGILIPFRPSGVTSRKPSPENSESPSNQGLQPHQLPPNDDPEFEAIHKKGVAEYLREETSRAPQQTPSDSENED